MTVFDIMPSLWLFSSFLFFVLYLLTENSFAVCAMSSSLLSFAMSLASLPMYMQCFGFVLITFFEFVTVFICGRRKRKRISCAVSDITAKGGYTKLHGEIIETVSRDKYIRYKTGELFYVKEHNGKSVMFGKHT